MDAPSAGDFGRAISSLALAILLTACASAKTHKTPDLLAGPQLPVVPPGVISPEQVQKAERLRNEASELLYSKDPSVKDPKAAFAKFQEAANLGDPISMDQLGGYYTNGLAGVEKSCEKALEWFEKSSQAGYPLAVNNLAYTLVTCPNKKLRDADKAEEMVKFLLQANPSIVALLDTYAAVLAEQGHFPQAAKTLEVVEDLASLMGTNPERIDEIKTTRQLYLKKKKLEHGKEADPKTFRKTK